MSYLENATFICFKPTGKYYTEARGHFPNVFSGSFFAPSEKLAAVFSHNNDKWPGLANKGEEFVRVAIIDEAANFGWPQMFPNTVQW